MKRQRRTAATLAWLFCGLTAVAPAWGQDAPSASEPEREVSSKLYGEARTALRDADYPLCFAKATAAWAVDEHPKIGAIRADCAARTGKHLEAIRSATAVADRLEGPIGERMEEVIDTARPHVSWLRLSVTPSDAKVTLDGELLNGVPLPLYLPPGEHRLLVEAARYEEVERVVSLTAGQESRLVIALERAGQTPPMPTPVSNPDPDDPPQVEPSAAPAWPWVAGVGGVLSAGLLVGGVVLRRDGQSIDDGNRVLIDELGHDGATPGACAQQEALCQTIDEQTAAADERLNASTGLLVAGGALGLVTLVTSVALAASETDSGANKEEEERAHVRWEPILGPRRAGLSAAWRW